MVLKYWRRKKIANTLTSAGIHSAARVSISSSFRMMMKIGMMVSWVGTISAASSTTKIESRPRNGIREKAYAAREAVSSEPATLITVTIRLFTASGRSGSDPPRRRSSAG